MPPFPLSGHVRASIASLCHKHRNFTFLWVARSKYCPLWQDLRHFVLSEQATCPSIIMLTCSRCTQTMSLSPTEFIEFQAEGPQHKQLPLVPIPTLDGHNVCQPFPASLQTPQMPVPLALDFPAIVAFERDVATWNTDPSPPPSPPSYAGSSSESSRDAWASDLHIGADHSRPKPQSRKRSRLSKTAVRKPRRRSSSAPINPYDSPTKPSFRQAAAGQQTGSRKSVRLAQPRPVVQAPEPADPSKLDFIMRSVSSSNFLE